MNITAAELKSHLKKLAPVKNETYQLDSAGVSAQDPDVWVNVGFSFIDGGPYNVNGKKLAQVVNRMSGSIEITNDQTRIVLKSAKAKVELEIQQIKPRKLPESPSGFSTFEPVEFKKAIAVAAASASPNKASDFGGVVLLQSRPLGIDETAPSGYRITGTDAVILTVANKPQALAREFKTLLNLTAAGIVQLMDEEIRVSETDTHVHISSGRTDLYASKPVQKYPGFDSILAVPANLVLKFKPEQVLAALRTVEPLIDNDQVGLLFREGVVQLSSVGVGSTATDEAEYEQVDPDPLFDPKEVKLTMRPAHLSGFLSKAAGEVSMSLVSNKHPVRMEAGGVAVVTMPVKGSK